MIDAKVYMRSGNWHHTLDNPVMPRHYKTRLGAAKALRDAVEILIIQSNTQIIRAQGRPDPSDFDAGCAPVVQNNTKYSAAYPLN